MIRSKEDLLRYLEMDKKALGKEYNRPRLFGDEVWKFEITLRKHEYYLNTGRNRFLCKWYQFKHHILGIILGFSIPCNVFGGGYELTITG